MVVARLTIPSPQPPWEDIGGVAQAQAQADAQIQQESQAENEDWDESVHSDGRNDSKEEPPHKLTPM